MALRDMIEQIAERVALRVIEARFGSQPVVMEIARGPDGSILGDHNNQCWLKKVSLSSTDDTSPVIKADNYATPIQVGLKVMYGSRDGYDGTKKEVLGLAYDSGGYLENGEKISSVAKHGHTHGISTSFNTPYQVHSHDAITIGVPNIEPLRTRPSAAGGVAIDVEALEYRYNGTSTVFGGITNLSLSGDVPGSGLQRFVAVYLDKDTNTIKTSNGGTIAVGAGRPPDPTISDTNVILSSYVRLKNGATSISVTDDISDQRDVIGGAIKISNVPYSNAGTGTQLTTEDDVALTADIQFQGDVLIGGDAGDSPQTTLHVGHGTTAPTNTADGVYVATENADAQISVADVSNGVEAGILVTATGSTYIGTWTNNSFRFRTNNQDRVTVESGGEVGIGTTAPHADLHIEAADPRLMIQDTESTSSSGQSYVVWAESDGGGDSEDAFRAGYDNGDFVIAYSSDDNNGAGSYTDLVTVDNTGQVGIGQSAPIYDLHIGPYSNGLTVNSGVGLYIGADTGAGIAQIVLEDETGSVEGGAYAHTNGQMYMGTWTSSKLNLRTGLTTAITIDTSQRVGINQTTPAAPLHVEQDGASTTEPVLKLVQANNTEDIFEIVGSSNSSSPLTRTLVDEGAVTTATREGWIKIVIQDDGTELTDSVYYIPFYTLA